MKALLFVCALVFSQFSLADIQIVSFEGIYGVQYNGTDHIITINNQLPFEFRVTFFSTEVTGQPRITSIDNGISYTLPLQKVAYPVLAVNQITALEPVGVMSYYGPLFRIGIDGDNDGLLDGANDDFTTVQVIFK